MEVYINGDMEEKLEKLEEWMKREEIRIRTIIEGDVNARIANKERRINVEEGREEEMERTLKDKKLNKERKVDRILEREDGLF
ncbi:hypothetical protein P5V15_002678 [Pogonomyrmex californicus]